MVNIKKQLYILANITDYAIVAHNRAYRMDSLVAYFEPNGAWSVTIILADDVSLKCIVIGLKSAGDLLLYRGVVRWDVRTKMKNLWVVMRNVIMAPFL